MTTTQKIGFIGLGVMGGPMCRNMAERSGSEARAFDLCQAARDALADSRAVLVDSIADAVREADIVFLSLPGAAQVDALCCGEGGISSIGRRGLLVVDLSTTTVASARSVAERLTAVGMEFADAPVARTREAAIRGELSIMVGSDAATFERLRPLLGNLATAVTHCGAVGAGQAVKLINNALVFEHVAALAEMMVIGERAGVEPAVFLDAVSRGSGDSFVLRNHGTRAMLPRSYPERSFSADYVLKDLGGVLELTAQTGVSARVTETARAYYGELVAAGSGSRYFPVLMELAAGRLKPGDTSKP